MGDLLLQSQSMVVQYSSLCALQQFSDIHLGMQNFLKVLIIMQEIELTLCYQLKNFWLAPRSCCLFLLTAFCHSEFLLKFQQSCCILLCLSSNFDFSFPNSCQNSLHKQLLVIFCCIRYVDDQQILQDTRCCRSQRT